MRDYLSSSAALGAVAITWGIGLILLCAGAGLGGRREAPEFRIGAGWGGLCLVLTVWGVLLPVSLRVPAIAIVLFAALFVRRLPRAEWQTLFRVTLLALPLWLVMAPIRPSQPDTFLNLLPNAVYLVDYGRFPAAALPPSFSLLPAAPYDTQFLAFLGGLIDPGYPASGMSLVNVLLYIVAGLAIARVLAAEDAKAPLPWSLAALGPVLATLLNPGFVPRIDFAAYGEPALAVTALLAALWFAKGPASPLGVALVLAAMVNAKQSGIGLVAASLGAAGFAFWAERGCRLPWLRLLVISAIPAALLYAVWRYFVAHAGVDELTVLPLAEWHWALLPQIVTSMALEAAGKPVYFGAVAIALIVWPILLARQGWTAATRLLAFHAAAFVLYNLFLILAYLGQFSDEMSAGAHSYFRYCTHLSLVLVAALALAARDFGLGSFFARHARPAAVAVIAVALVGPLGFAQRLRFDLVMPQPLVWDLAAAVKPHLTEDDRLALLLPGDNDSVAAMLSGVLRDAPPRRKRLDLLVRQKADPATLDEAAALGYAKALISCTAERTAVLMSHDSSGWRTVAAWPYPADVTRRRWQHILAWEPLCRTP